MQYRVFVHTNHRQLVGAVVSAHSFRRRSAHADKFDVALINHGDYPFFQLHEGELYRRAGNKIPWRNDDLQSFTPLRFMPPELMGYEGRALVVDLTCSRSAISGSCSPATCRARPSCAGCTPA